MTEKPDFHKCALQAGFIAAAEGRLLDSKYVKSLAYEFYEEDLAAYNLDKSHKESLD